MMWKDKTFDEHLPEEVLGVTKAEYELLIEYKKGLWTTIPIQMSPLEWVPLPKIKWIDVPSIHAPILESLLRINPYRNFPMKIALINEPNLNASTDIMPTLMWLHEKREHLFSYYKKQGQIRVRMAAAPRQYLSPNYNCRGIASSLRANSRFISDNFNDEWLNTYKKCLPIARWKNIQDRERYCYEESVRAIQKYEKGLKECNMNKAKELLKDVLTKNVERILKYIPFGSFSYSWSPLSVDDIEEHMDYDFNIFPHGENLKMDLIETHDEWKTQQEDMKKEITSLLSVLISALEIDEVTE